jgi:hypothetical protein
VDIPPKQSQSSSSSNTQSHVVDRKHRPDLSRNAYVQEREMVYNSGFDYPFQEIKARKKKKKKTKKKEH